MNPLGLALQVLQMLPGLVSAGVQIEGVVASTIGTLRRAQAENRDPTPEEWNAIHTEIEAARQELRRPEAR